MKKVFIIILLMSLFFGNVYSQKKIISQAKTYIKSGKDLDKAEKLMSDLLKDTANTKETKIWLTLFEAVKKQYEQGNEKLYLKQKYDTTALFVAGRKMFSILESLDSVEMMPDKDGHVKIKYRDKHAEYLDMIRPNLFNGGVFFTQKHDYAKAFDFYEAYIDCVHQPLFTDYHYENDELLPRAAYGTMYAGYKLEKPELTLKYADLAQKDTENIDYVRQYIAETYRMQRDTTRYVEVLLRGFAHNPRFPYFFPRLIDYYSSTDQLDSAMIIVDKALATDSTNQVYRFAKSTVLLNLGKYDESIAICDSLINENDSLADVYYNLGLAYFNQAIEMDIIKQRTRSVQRKIEALYKKSLPYMEKYRQLSPEEQDKWMPVLYTIYLNLNMGKEFDGIEKIRKK